MTKNSQISNLSYQKFPMGVPPLPLHSQILYISLDSPDFGY